MAIDTQILSILEQLEGDTSKTFGAVLAAWNHGPPPAT